MASLLGARDADLWLVLVRIVVLECLPLFGSAMDTVTIRELNLVSFSTSEASASSYHHVLAMRFAGH